MKGAAISLFLGLMTLSATPASAAVAASSEELNLAKQWNDAADSFMTQGSFDAARKLYLRSLPVLERELGPDHRATVNTLGNLCVATSHVSGYLDAKPLCARALAAREKILGPNHPDVARSLSDMAVLYGREGDFSRAEPLLARALKIARSLPDSADLPALLNNLGFLSFQEKKYATAATLFARAIALTEKSRGPGDAGLVDMLTNLGTVDLANHRFAAAEKHFRRALDIAGPDQARSVHALVGLARAEAAQGKHPQAAATLRTAEDAAGSGESYLEWARSLAAARADLGRQ